MPGYFLIGSVACFYCFLMALRTGIGQNPEEHSILWRIVSIVACPAYLFSGCMLLINFCKTI